MNLKKCLALLMLALLAVPSISMYGYSEPSTVDPETDCELASNILTLVEGSRATAESLFQSLEEAGTEIPEEAERAFEKGDELLEEALELMNAGECAAAAEKLWEALQHFGKAGQKALMAEVELEEPEEPEELEAMELEEEAERAISLRDEIERAYSFLEKVNETATDFEEQGNDVSDIRSQLLEANQTLNAAEEALDEGNLDLADELKSTAREMIGQAMGTLQSMNKDNNVEKAAEFLDKTEERLQELQEMLNEILDDLDLPPEAVEGINGAFVNAQNKMQVIKDLLKAGDLENAIDEIEDVLEDSDKVLDAVDEHDHGLGNKLRSIAKIKAKLDILKGTIQTLEDEGEYVSAMDVSGMEELLKAARDKLDSASGILTAEGLVVSQVDEMEELIDGAEELVEQVDDMLDDLKEVIDERIEEGEHSEELEDEAEELREELNELLEEIQGLNQATGELTLEDADLTAITGLLEAAEAILLGINPEDGKEAVENQIDIAKDMIDEADALIEELLETEEEPEVKTAELPENELTERIEGLEEELASLEEEIEELRDKQVNVEQLTDQITMLRNIIEEAKTSENPEELVEEAEILIEEIKDLLDTLG